MKSYAIVIRDNETSENGFTNLLRSSFDVGNDFDINRFEAVTPNNVDDIMSELSIEWTWPHTGSTMDTKTGIKKVGYGGRDPKRRRACGMSHYLLWKECVEISTPILVLEHDAIFIERLNPESLLDSKYEVIGLNNPYGATRLPGVFDRIVKESKEDILPVPEIDRPEIAQGIAGNSAYMIKPTGAKKLLELVKEHGMWNNDAIMCRQLMPNMIGVTKTYYTKVQKLPSTTMGEPL